MKVIDFVSVAEGKMIVDIVNEEDTLIFTGRAKMIPYCTLDLSISKMKLCDGRLIIEIETNGGEKHD